MLRSGSPRVGPNGVRPNVSAATSPLPAIEGRGVLAMPLIEHPFGGDHRQPGGSSTVRHIRGL